MVLQPLRARVGLGAHSLKASSRVPQLEAEIATLKEAPRQRQQIGVATGQLARPSRSILSRVGRPGSRKPTTRTVASLAQD